MLKTKWLIILLLLTFGLLSAQNWKTFGKELTLKDTTLISTILANPYAFIGKRVLVEGTVVDVCKKRGCWMELASDKEFQSIRVKVNDGEIVFPLEARGKLALIEGIVEKLEISKEELIKAMKHHAEEQGEPFDSTKITEGKTIYRLKGLVAKIQLD
ncbi:MAG TPA: DUF4920 domain-containing protein [Caldithrix abyssi]|uniref:DUF4920 domain-containing protein n=1 Tax=Caldithrix abyssi TaxID=187145 RepID=A0A7V5H3Q5_CALAY|nr:DUF4920 domain-containing protein [Caldithrix abyssi]